MTADPADEEREGPRKGPDAFRTISEVAEELGLPQHVLRFWESRFPQIKPVKRGGGRRYYRPNDVELLRGVKQLLYGEGYTIRGVQRILREQGGRKLAQAAGLAPKADASFEDHAPADQSSGPELWAPQRRTDPPLSRPTDDLLDPFASDSLERASRVTDAPSTANAEPKASPPSRGRLSDEQAGRLAAALDDLTACRRLLSGRS